MAKIHLVPQDWDHRLVTAIAAEFLGTLLFQFFAAASNTPLAGALAYSILVYATQHSSGGHLNPAITIATVVSRHTTPAVGLLYVVAQVLGAIVGATLEVGLLPGVHFGKASGFLPHAPGCYYTTDVTNLELFGWETVMTFLLVYVLYSVAVADPGHGSLGPLALGLTLFVADSAGGRYTGASLNPARLLGPAFVFLCTWKTIWVYLLGQILGALAAGGLSASVLGRGSAVGALGQAEGREPLISREGAQTRADV